MLVQLPSNKQRQSQRIPDFTIGNNNYERERRSTVKAVYTKFIGFMSFKKIR